MSVRPFLQIAGEFRNFRNLWWRQDRLNFWHCQFAGRKRLQARTKSQSHTPWTISSRSDCCATSNFLLSYVRDCDVICGSQDARYIQFRGAKVATRSTSARPRCCAQSDPRICMPHIWHADMGPLLGTHTSSEAPKMLMKGLLDPTSGRGVSTRRA